MADFIEEVMKEEWMVHCEVERERAKKRPVVKARDWCDYISTALIDKPQQTVQRGPPSTPDDRQHDPGPLATLKETTKFDTETVGTPKEDTAMVKKPSDIATLESSDAATAAVEGKEDGGKSDRVKELNELRDPIVVASALDFSSKTVRKLEDLQKKSEQSSKNKRSVESYNDAAEFIRSNNAWFPLVEMLKSKGARSPGELTDDQLIALCGEKGNVDVAAVRKELGETSTNLKRRFSEMAGTQIQDKKFETSIIDDTFYVGKTKNNLSVFARYGAIARVCYYDDDGEKVNTTLSKLSQIDVRAMELVHSEFEEPHDNTKAQAVFRIKKLIGRGDIQCYIYKHGDKNKNIKGSIPVGKDSRMLDVFRVEDKPCTGRENGAENPEASRFLSPPKRGKGGQSRGQGDKSASQFMDSDDEEDDRTAAEGGVGGETGQAAAKIKKGRTSSQAEDASEVDAGNEETQSEQSGNKKRKDAGDRSLDVPEKKKNKKRETKTPLMRHLYGESFFPKKKSDEIESQTTAPQQQNVELEVKPEPAGGDPAVKLEQSPGAEVKSEAGEGGLAGPGAGFGLPAAPLSSANKSSLSVREAVQLEREKVEAQVRAQMLQFERDCGLIMFPNSAAEGNL